MGKSGNPAKKAEERRISQVGDFKKRLGGLTELPSGVTVKLRNPGGMRAFLGSGQIPNSLMGMIQEGLNKGKNIKPEALMKDKALDPEMIKDIMVLMDTICLQTIVDPKVHPVPTDEDVETFNEKARVHNATLELTPNKDAEMIGLVEDPEELRSDFKLYIDEIPDEDKQFIFQWISGGTRDLEAFRAQLQNNVAAVAAVAEPKSDALVADRPDAG